MLAIPSFKGEVTGVVHAALGVVVAPAVAAVDVARPTVRRSIAPAAKIRDLLSIAILSENTLIERQRFSARVARKRSV
jgi:hypothetical protein